MTNCNFLHFTFRVEVEAGGGGGGEGGIGRVAWC